MPQCISVLLHSLVENLAYALDQTLPVIFGHGLKTVRASGQAVAAKVLGNGGDPFTLSLLDEFEEELLTLRELWLLQRLLQEVGYPVVVIVV